MTDPGRIAVKLSIVLGAAMLGYTLGFDLRRSELLVTVAGIGLVALAVLAF